MKRAGYDETASIIATAVTCSIGSIISSFVTDMPLIVAPPTSVSIFLAVSVQQQGLDHLKGNTAVMISGALLAIIGALPPLARVLAKVTCPFHFFTPIDCNRYCCRCVQLVPDCIQASTSIGIGLITALAGATELGLVVRGKYTIIDMGQITDEVS